MKDMVAIFLTGCGVGFLLGIAAKGMIIGLILLAIVGGGLYWYFASDAMVMIRGWFGKSSDTEKDV